MDRTNVEGVPTPVLEAVQFGIAGMTCDKCVATIEKALQRIDGVQDIRVDREAARASVTFERDKTDVPAIHDAVLKAGYRPSAIPQR